MTITESISEYLLSLQFQRLPSDILEICKLTILDTIGCGIFGSKTDSAPKLVDALLGIDRTPDCTIWGYNQKTSTCGAALANGTLSHSFELDDCLYDTHAGAVIIPAALAVGEKEHAKGMDLMSAVVGAYEALGRINSGFNRLAIDARGWHPTGILGSFGAAAAAGKLLGLSKDQMVMALGLAGSYSGGIWAFLADGSMSKRYHAGKASQTGVLAAYIAREGFTGPRQVLEAKYGGFYDTYVPESSDSSRVLEGIGKSYMIAEKEFKPYPTCSATHSAIDSVIRLRQTYDFTTDDVAKIIIFLHPSDRKVTDKLEINTILDAQMSMQYAVALAAKYGHIKPEHFNESILRSKEISQVASKIQLLDESRVDELEVYVELHLKDNRVLKQHVVRPTGTRENPMRPSQIEDKFMHLTQTVLSKQRARKILDTVMAMEEVDAGTLCCLLGT